MRRSHCARQLAHGQPLASPPAGARGGIATDDVRLWVWHGYKIQQLVHGLPLAVVPACAHGGIASNDVWPQA
eukprot:10514256-Alexandrium_andersonii.AAC.3